MKGIEDRREFGRGKGRQGVKRCYTKVSSLHFSRLGARLTGDLMKGVRSKSNSHLLRIFLEVKLPYEPVDLSVSVGCLVGLSVCHNFKFNYPGFYRRTCFLLSAKSVFSIFFGSSTYTYIYIPRLSLKIRKHKSYEVNLGSFYFQ